MRLGRERVKRKKLRKAEIERESIIYLYNTFHLANKYLYTGLKRETLIVMKINIVLLVLPGVC